MSESNNKIPTTVLSGFLGSGKTTLLNRMLQNCGDKKLALLVNDVGEINVDASLIKTKLKELDDSATQMVELTNGCICCTIQGDLERAVEELVKTSGADHIVIEASGVAEPTQIVQAFFTADVMNNKVVDHVDINALVTVIDSALFAKEWKRIHKDDTVSEMMRQDDPQPVFELMVEQIECADIVLLNKKDLLGEGEDKLLLEVVSGLNSRAECRLVEESEVDVQWLLESRAFKTEDTIGAPRWMQELNKVSEGEASRFELAGDSGSIGLGTQSLKPKENAVPDFSQKYGLKTFIYRERIPFKAAKISAFMQSPHAGVLRAKGFAWIAERSDQVALVSVAGDVNRCDFIGDWWATSFEAGRVKREDFPEDVARSWEDPFGDRRQEIVFIGIGMDEEAIRNELDECLICPEDLGK